MKKLIFVAALLPVIIGASCGLKEQKKITMPQVEQFQDSIPKIIPGTRSIHTLQHGDDVTKVVIIVGAPSFYDADASRKQEAAIRTGLMVLRVLGPENCISNATLVISKKDSNEDQVPEDGIRLDMKIDSLQKVVFGSR